MEGEIKGLVGVGQVASEVCLFSCHLFIWVWELSIVDWTKDRCLRVRDV